MLIAGTYTPISMLCLPPQKAALLLWLVWGGAALGIGFRVLWVGAPRWLYVPLYVLLGWAAVMFLGDLFAANWVTMTLVIVGGLLYTAGAIVYGLKRPNPFPGKFGFHEIFHTFTLLAFLCHWTAILLVALRSSGAVAPAVPSCSAAILSLRLVAVPHPADAPGHVDGQQHGRSCDQEDHHEADHARADQIRIAGEARRQASASGSRRTRITTVSLDF